MSDNLTDQALAARIAALLPGLRFMQKESGSFTPVLVGTTTPGTFTYNAASTLVQWTRHADRVFFTGRTLITAITVAPVGNMTITGFPYAGAADATMAIAGGAEFIRWQFNVAAGYTHVTGQIGNNTVMVLVKNGDNLASANVTGGEVALLDAGGTAIDLRFRGDYMVG